MRILFTAGLLALAGAVSSTPALAQSLAPAPSAAAQATEDVVATKSARTELDAFLSGKIDRTHYAAQANAQLTDAIVTRVSGLLAPAGRVTAFAYQGAGDFQGVPASKYAITFERALPLPNGGSSKDFIESIAWDKDGKVTLIFFAPKGM